MDSIVEFHTERISRRGEAILWVLALTSLAAIIVLRSQKLDVSIWHLAFVLLMLVSAASTSLGNWMDRNTLLTLRPDGVDYRNGLRDVSLTWDEIQEVLIFPSRFGNLVHVIGSNAHFRFRTMSESTHKGNVRDRMGFAQGEFIIEQILKYSGMQEIDQTGKSRSYNRP